MEKATNEYSLKEYRDEYRKYKAKMARYNRQFRAINPNLGEMKPVTLSQFVETYFNTKI